MEDELRVHGIQNVDFRVLFCLQSDLSPLEGCNGPSLSDWASLPFLSRGFDKRWMHSAIALTRQRQAAVTRQRQENRTTCELVRKIDKIHRLVNNTREYLQRDPKLTQSRWEALVERRIDSSESSLSWACCPKCNDRSASGPSAHTTPISTVQQDSTPIPPSTSMSHGKDERTNNIYESREHSELYEAPTANRHYAPSLPTDKEEDSICVVLDRSEPSDSLTKSRDSSPEPSMKISHGQDADSHSFEPAHQCAGMSDLPTAHSSAYDSLTPATTFLACLHCRCGGIPTLRSLALHGQNCPKTPGSALAKTMEIIPHQCVLCERKCRSKNLARHERSPHYYYSCGAIATGKGHDDCPQVPTRLERCVRETNPPFDPVSYLLSARPTGPTTVESTAEGVIDIDFNNLPPKEIGLLLRLSDEELGATFRKALIKRLSLVRSYHSPDSGIGTQDISYSKGSTNYTAGEHIGYIEIDHPQLPDQRHWMAGESSLRGPSQSSEHRRPAASTTAPLTSSINMKQRSDEQHSMYRIPNSGTDLTLSSTGSPIFGHGYLSIAPRNPTLGRSTAASKSDASSCLQDGISYLPHNEGVSVSLNAAGTINSAPSAGIAALTQHSEKPLRSTTFQTLGPHEEQHSAPLPMSSSIHAESQHAMACAGHPDAEDRPAKRPRVSPIDGYSLQTHPGPPLRQQSTFPHPEQLGTASPEKQPTLAGQGRDLFPPAAPMASGHTQASHPNEKETSHQSPNPPPIHPLSYTGRAFQDEITCQASLPPLKHGHNNGFHMDESIVFTDARVHVASPHESPNAGHGPHLYRSSWQEVAFGQTHSESQHIPSSPSSGFRTTYGDPASRSNVIFDQPPGVDDGKRRLRRIARFTIPANIQAALGWTLFTGIGRSSLGKKATSQDSTYKDAVVTEVPNHDGGDWITKVTLSSTHGRAIQQCLEEEGGAGRMLPKPVSDAIYASQRQQRGERAIRILPHGGGEDCQLEFAMDNARGRVIFCLLHAVPKR